MSKYCMTLPKPNPHNQKWSIAELFIWKKSIHPNETSHLSEISPKRKWDLT